MTITLDRECLADYWALAGSVVVPKQARTVLFWGCQSTHGGQFVTVRSEITNN